LITFAKIKKMKFATKAIHAGLQPDPSTGAVMTPIYQTSTYAQESPGVHQGYEYARTQNPTRTALEANLAALENARFARAFASGMAATDTLLKLLRPGDEIISTNDLYGGTYRIFKRVFEPFGLVFRFTPMNDVEAIQAHFSPKTKMVWVETPTNPMMNIIDIEAVADLCKKNGVILVVDNTFASPYLQNPLDLGATLVMHSVTKYIGGHSDLIMGAVMTNESHLEEQLAFLQNSCGAVPGPQDCFLALRGIKTLHLRAERHCQNGAAIAHFLETHPQVAKVFWPGLTQHPGHLVAKRQMRDFGGMVSFTLKDDQVSTAKKFMESLQIFTLAESLGGVESLVGHPATMTHASIPREHRLASGLSDSLIRLSVGVEDAEDLKDDLKQAFERLTLNN
jgi:cystathionine beta-lyase/cystathionine gamma-synthase